MQERNLCSQGTVVPEPVCETFLSHAHKTRYHWSVSLRSHLRHARATKAFRFPPMAAHGKQIYFRSHRQGNEELLARTTR